MNKLVKRVLMVAIPVVVFVVGILIYSYFPMLMMSPTQTGAVADGDVYAIKNNIGSVYLVRTDAGYILIDAGSDAAALEESLRGANVGVDEVKWILLTHSDYDHVAGLPLFAQADIYMSEEEIKLVTGLEKRSYAGGNTLPEGVDADRIKPLQNSQELLLGGTKVECVMAPGHTIGAMVYRVDGRLLFTGDAFKVSGGKAKVHPYSMNNKQSQETIGSLREFVNGSELVLTSHYGVFTDLKVE
ncbi:MAG: MBL fold metallo-hydrolase [Peptococcaceae bacterium]|nr:MBL fold metallo-hydrolase [Peptococcaceae bacterium]